MRRIAPVLFALALLAIPSLADALPNFQVVNEHVLRGGQPTDDGIKSLAVRGVKTVIDLRPGSEHSIPHEKQIVESHGMRFVSVPISGLSPPTADQISRILSILDDSDAWPVFVHCRRGKDRTGTVMACYRIHHDQWQNRKALEEAKSYGFSFFARAMKNYIEQFKPLIALP